MDSKRIVGTVLSIGLVLLVWILVAAAYSAPAGTVRHGPPPTRAPAPRVALSARLPATLPTQPATGGTNLARVGLASAEQRPAPDVTRAPAGDAQAMSAPLGLFFWSLFALVCSWLIASRRWTRPTAQPLPIRPGAQMSA